MAYNFDLASVEAPVQNPNGKDNNFFTLSEKGHKGFRNDTLAVATVWNDKELVFKTKPLPTEGGEAKEFYAAMESLVRQGLAAKGYDDIESLTKMIYFFWPAAAKRYKENNKEI